MFYSSVVLFRLWDRVSTIHYYIKLFFTDDVMSVDLTEIEDNSWKNQNVRNKLLNIVDRWIRHTT